MQEDSIETVKDSIKCATCIYRRRLSAWMPYCDYIGIENKPRGCSVSECDKYKPGKKVRPRIHENYGLDWDWEAYEVQEYYRERQESIK